MPENEVLPTKPVGTDPAVPSPGPGPTKGSEAPPVRLIEGQTVVKAEVGPAPAEAPPAYGHGGDQHAKPEPGPANGTGYVRFRMRVDNGAISIVGSHLVDGPLAMPATLHAEHVYEVTGQGSRLLHADSVPDAGVVRSFPSPDGPPELQGHHSYRMPVYEFDARVPVEELTPSALPAIRVALYRMKERSPVTPASISPLGVQFERELREVARLEGIDPERVPRS